MFQGSRCHDEEKRSRIKKNEERVSKDEVMMMMMMMMMIGNGDTRDESRMK